MNFNIIKTTAYTPMVAPGSFKLDPNSSVSETAQWASYLNETFPNTEEPVVLVENDDVIECGTVDKVSDDILKFSSAGIKKIKELPLDNSFSVNLKAIAVDELANIKGAATSIDDVIAANNIIINELTEDQRQFMVSNVTGTYSLEFLLDSPQDIITSVNVRLALS